MRALVLGATGFVGINVVDALLAAGATVRVSRRSRSPMILLGRRPVEPIDADLDAPDSLRRAMEGCDAVFLTGAYYPKDSLDLESALARGVGGVRNACEAARAVGVGRFVYTSTIATLDRAPAGRVADARDVPAEMPRDSVYRAVKWAMERVVDAAVAEGLPAVTLQPGGCVGPWDARAGTGGILLGVVHGTLPWYLDGTVNLIDVLDVARAHVAAVTAPVGRRYPLGGHTVDFAWLVQHLAARYGGRVPALRVSADEARARADADERAAAATRRRVPFPRELVDLIATGQPVSDDLARAELGLAPGPLDAALDRAHAWYARFRYLPQSPPKDAS
jgi:dihydroflavonol-4-reductase